MTTLFIGHPVPLDVEAAGLVAEFGHVWLVTGEAWCGGDGSPLEPVMTADDHPAYVCDAVAHTWNADAVDAAAWGTVLGSGLADEWLQAGWRGAFLDLDAPTAADITDPGDRRRIVTRLRLRWLITPLDDHHGNPPVRLILPAR